MQSICQRDLALLHCLWPARTVVRLVPPWMRSLDQVDEYAVVRRMSSERPSDCDVNRDLERLRRNCSHPRPYCAWNSCRVCGQAPARRQHRQSQDLIWIRRWVQFEPPALIMDHGVRIGVFLMNEYEDALAIFLVESFDFEYILSWFDYVCGSAISLKSVAVVWRVCSKYLP